MTCRIGRKSLFATTALGCVLWASLAAAQSAEPAGVEEVVVTATRQTDTVNRVPLSITAVTQAGLDRQGIKSVADLQRTTPALTVTAGASSGIGNYAIRGVLATSGAATTGLYLDDVALQKRNAISVGNNPGTPAPPLFDLERVEVLRGPQGTLYGGSSVGGTIRFITPQPSLTTYSGFGKTEVSSTEHGELSYEAGAAVGGPIIQDRLGFRVSAWRRHDGGWIDMRDPYTAGAPVRFENANFTDTVAFRAALTAALTDRATATLSAYHSVIHDKGGTSATTLSTAAFTTPQACFNGSTAAVACTTPGAYVRPAQTYGPYDLESDDSLTWNLAPSKTRLDVASLTLNYDFEHMNVKSITSYLHDQTLGATPETGQVSTAQRSILLFRPFPNYAGYFQGSNKRHGIMEELRFASSGSAKPFSWVAGVYFSNFNQSASNYVPEDTDRIAGALFGITSLQRYNLPKLPDGSISSRTQNLTDTELAGFGEGNYYVTDKLKLTAGVRVSRVEFKFNTIYGGPTAGLNVPTVENGGLSGGTVTESPVTPKFGAQYQFTDNDMVYVNAAKGFRAGGVNPVVTPFVCGPGLALVGLTTNDIPRTYNSDSVWSYEAGAKLRLFGNRVQVNSSVYRIDWTDVQLTVGIPGCGVTYAVNAGSARSQGVDMQAQARLFDGLTLNLAFGYTDAKYTSTVSGPKPLTGVAVPVVNTGDTLPVPPWQVTAGLQYDFMLAGRFNAFLRGDYQYAGKYFRSLGPGVNAYAPDTREAEAVDRINLRAGIDFNRWELNVFVNNLANSKDALAESGGRSGCPVAQGAACTSPANLNPLFTETYFRPREVGVSAKYRF